MGRERETRQSTRKKGGKGTHGSTTKAGKVRMQTPKIPKTIGLRKKAFPRKRNRRNYEKRERLKRTSGQNWVR